MKIDELEINSELIKAVKELGFEEPTLIQEKTVPIVRKGTDVIAQAKTGSGKTAAFGLPILEKIEPRKGIQALILCPTRELAEQISKELFKFSKYKRCFIVSIYGGVSINPQIDMLPKADIVVGTPGRILDHISRNTINLTNVKFAVLDEADRMLDMGFIDDVEQILSRLPKQRQTMLFSATIPSEISRLTRKFMNNPEKVVTSTRVGQELMEQFYYDVPTFQKFSLLVHLIKKENPTLAMVFCATRRNADLVGANLKNAGIVAKTLHGGLSQNKRSHFMDEFKNGNIHVLVVTDVAARGLDVKNVTHIFNYDLPRDPSNYIHRIGRTARAGEKGKAISLLARPDYEFFGPIDTRENNVKRLELEKFPEVPFAQNVYRDNERRGGFRSGGRFGGRGHSRGRSNADGPRHSQHSGHSRGFGKHTPGFGR